MPMPHVDTWQPQELRFSEGYLQNLDMTLENKKTVGNPQKIEFKPEMTEFAGNRLCMCVSFFNHKVKSGF